MVWFRGVSIELYFVLSLILIPFSTNYRNTDTPTHPQKIFKTLITTLMWGENDV